MCGAVIASPTELHLKTDTTLATAGYFQLNWQGGHGDDYVVQQSASNTFIEHRTIYTGPDEATVLTGLSNGEYFYRVGTRDQSGARVWSSVIRVTVAHHSLSRAWMFFAMGAVVFVAILGAITVGSRKYREVI